MKKSALQKARAAYQPKLPIVLFPNTYGLPELKFEKNPTPSASKPVNVGVILSGGQAPGGHNVISGLFDGIRKINKESRLYGFLMGHGGFVDHQYVELTSAIIDEFRNTGGFDIIGSGRTKLETKEQFDKGLETLRESPPTPGCLPNITSPSMPACRFSAAPRPSTVTSRMT